MILELGIIFDLGMIIDCVYMFVDNQVEKIADVKDPHYLCNLALSSATNHRLRRRKPIQDIPIIEFMT
jgi:hypothetical protein